MTDFEKDNIRTTHARLAGGRKRVYYYTKSGGTRFFDTMDFQLMEPFPEPFKVAYINAVETEIRTHYKPTGDLDRFLTDYLGDADTLVKGEDREPHPGCKKFQDLAMTTRASYTGHAKAIRSKFGATPIAVIEDRRFRGEIIRWHEEMAASSPRSADSKLMVLSNSLNYAFKRGLIDKNPAASIDYLYQATEDKSPWSSEQEQLFLRDCPEVVSDIYWLAKFTGLRRTDLARITWDAIKGSKIIWKTSKSRGKRTVVIPLVPRAVAFLDDLKRRQMASKHGMQRTLLIGDRGRSMTPNTAGGKVNKRATELQIHRTLHQCRNGFATELVMAGFEDEEIAGILGWTIDDVKELKRIYVHADKIVSAQIARLGNRQNEWRTNKISSDNHKTPQNGD